MPTSSQQFARRACGASALRHVAVVDQRLGELVADAHHRVERGHRVLEDEADLAAAHLAQLATSTSSAGRGPAKFGRAGRDPDLVGQEPHQAAAWSGSCRSRIRRRCRASRPCRRAGRCRRRRSPGRRRVSISMVRPRDVEQRAGLAGAIICCPCGLSASLRPSPRKEKATVARPSTAAGAASRCG